jgi:hypothetical protein
MVHFLSSLCSAAGAAWCRAMHPDPMWPVKGVYQCRVCQRKFRVEWEQPVVEAVPVRAAAPAREAISPMTQSV